MESPVKVALLLNDTQYERPKYVCMQYAGLE